MHHQSPIVRLRRAITAIGIALFALAPSSASAAVWHDSYDWPAGDGYSGWSHQSNSADSGAYAFASPLTDHSGLSLWLPGDRWYLPAAAEWRFDAPGTTRIATAQVHVAYRDNLFAHHCLELGLRDSKAPDAHRACSPPTTDRTYDAALAADAKQAYMRVDFPPCHNTNANGCPKWIPSLDPEANAPLARAERVDMTLVDEDLPTATPSGPLFDRAEDYVNGNSAYDLTVAGSDAGAGVNQVAVERAGGAQLAAADGPCDPAHHTPELGARICPDSHSQTLGVPMQTLPEGSNALDATATDLAGNTGVSAPWNVLVDRTPPNPVSELDIDWDADTNEAMVGWEAEDDPDLPDGNPGSGIATYEYRYRHLGDDRWNGWQPAGGSADVPSNWIGELIEVEVRSSDAVGNVSETASEVLEVPDPADALDGEDGSSDEADDDVDSEDDDTASAAEVSSVTIRFAPTATITTSSVPTGCTAYPSTFFFKKSNNGGELRTTRAFPKLGAGVRITKFDPKDPKLPSCRLGAFGTVDLGRKTGARAGMSAQYHIDKDHGNLGLVPDRWRAMMRDSFGNGIARIRRVSTCGSRTGKLFEILTHAGRKYCNRVSAVKMTVQGYGCILPSSSARTDWIVFAYNGGDTSLQIRGFVWKAGLRRAVAAAITKKNLTDLPDAGCDNGDKTPQHSAHDLTDPNLTGSYFREAAPPPTSAYKTYNYRTVAGKPGTGTDVKYSYVLVNTSAVGSGGIMRAIIPILDQAGDKAALDQTDFLGYCDPNGAYRDPTTGDRKVNPRVRWSYGEVLYAGVEQNIEGWIPTSGLEDAPPPPGSDPTTPPTSPVLNDTNISNPDCGEKLPIPATDDRRPGYTYRD
ncbi:MAG TPA: hypothetical protein VF066_10580 [Thermoleophilaceae bacterium]